MSENDQKLMDCLVRVYDAIRGLTKEEQKAVIAAANALIGNK